MNNQLLELMLDGNYYTRYVSAIKKPRRRRMLGSGSSKKAVVQYASSIKAYIYTCLGIVEPGTLRCWACPSSWNIHYGVNKYKKFWKYVQGVRKEPEILNIFWTDLDINSTKPVVIFLWFYEEWKCFSIFWKGGQGGNFNVFRCNFYHLKGLGHSWPKWRLSMLTRFVTLRGCNLGQGWRSS